MDDDLWGDDFDLPNDVVEECDFIASQATSELMNTRTLDESHFHHSKSTAEFKSPLTLAPQNSKCIQQPEPNEVLSSNALSGKIVLHKLHIYKW